MKFSQELARTAIPEWRDAYLDYKKFKKLIKKVSKKYPPQKDEQAFLKELVALKSLRTSTSVDTTAKEKSDLAFSAMRNRKDDGNGSDDDEDDDNDNGDGDGGDWGRRAAAAEKHREVTPHPDAADSAEEKKFIKALDAELERICSFYREQRQSLSEKRVLLDEQILLLHLNVKNRQRKRRRNTKHESSTIATQPTSTRKASKGKLRRRSISVAPIMALPGEPSDTSGGTAGPFETRGLKKNKKVLKKSFLEYYRALTLLDEYQALNRLAFYKITKKHDKKTGLSISASYMVKVDASEFTEKAIQEEMERVERVFSSALYDGDRGKAMAVLRVPKLSWSPFDFLTFQIGFLAAFFLFACLAIVYFAATSDSLHQYPRHVSFFTMVRGLVLPAIMLAFFAINMHVWRKYHVNYSLIFTLDFRKPFDYRKLLVVSGYFLGSCALLILGFLGAQRINVTSDHYTAYGPFVVMCTFFGLLILPYPILRSQRLWAVRVLLRIFTAPLTKIMFEDFWVADQLNSLVLVFLDTHFTICYFAYGRFEATEADALATCHSPHNVLRAILAALPAWWRFIQCIRRYFTSGKNTHHLHNAGKYMSSLLVVTLSTLSSIHRSGSPDDTAIERTLLSLWILSLVLNTVYTMYWDFVNDWGLIERSKETNKRQFRTNRLYPFPMYVFGIINNILLRLAWSVSISIGYYGLFFSPGLVSILAVGEMWRRFWWNFFRLENEQLNNCGAFRATKDIVYPFAMPKPVKGTRASKINRNNDDDDSGDAGDGAAFDSNSEDEDDDSHDSDTDSEEIRSVQGSNDAGRSESNHAWTREVPVEDVQIDSEDVQVSTKDLAVSISR